MPKNAGFAFAHGGGVFGVVLCVLLWGVEWGLVCVCVVGVGFGGVCVCLVYVVVVVVGVVCHPFVCVFYVPFVGVYLSLYEFFVCFGGV